MRSNSVTKNPLCPPGTDYATNITRKGKGTMNTRLTIAAGTLGLLLTHHASAGLLGSSVTATGYYPNLSTILSGPVGPVTVGSGVEFPVDTLFFDGSVDVTDNQVI